MGTRRHRLTGFVWVAFMAVVAASSFWIHDLRVWGIWSPIHFLPGRVMHAVVFGN